MGIVGTTPGSFVRAANKGVAGYGTWKKVRRRETRGSKKKGGKEVRRLGYKDAERGKTDRVGPTGITVMAEGVGDQITTHATGLLSCKV